MKQEKINKCFVITITILYIISIGIGIIAYNSGVFNGQ